MPLAREASVDSDVSSEGEGEQGSDDQSDECIGIDAQPEELSCETRVLARARGTMGDFENHTRCRMPIEEAACGPHPSRRAEVWALASWSAWATSWGMELDELSAARVV